MTETPVFDEHGTVRHIESVTETTADRAEENDSKNGLELIVQPMPTIAIPETLGQRMRRTEKYLPWVAVNKELERGLLFF